MHKNVVCILFIDFKQALENIAHDYLFQLLESYGFSKQFQRCIRQIMGTLHRQSISMATERGSFPSIVQCGKDAL